VAPSDATEKNSNIGAQLQFLYTTAEKYFGKFTSYVTFGAHNLRPDPFLDYLYKV